MEQRIIRNKEHWVVDEDGDVLGFDHGTRTQYLATVETNPLTGGIIGIIGPDGNLIDTGRNGYGLLRKQGRNAIGSGSVLVDFTGTWTSVTNGTGANVATVNATGGLNSGKSATLQRGADGTYIAIKQSSLSLTFDSTDVLTLVVDSISGIANNDNIRIELSSDNFSAKSALLTHTLKTVHGDKVYMSFVLSDATLNGGELVSNTFNYMGIRLTSAVGSSCRVLGVYKNNQARPKLLIDFDDGFASQYTQVFRYMAKYGLVGNIAVIERAVGKTAGQIDSYDYCTLAQLQEMYAAGWDMMTHGYWNHSDVHFTGRADLLADVKSNRDYLLNNGMSRAAYHYVYPGGVISTANDSIGVLAECGMKTGRTVEANPTPTYPTGVDSLTRLWSRDLSNTTTIATALAMVDRAINTGSTIRCHGHRAVASIVDGYNEVTITDWRSFVDGLRDRIKDGLIDNQTITQWYSYNNS